MDAETVHAIAQLAQEADHNGELSCNIKLQNDQTYTFRNNATEYGRQLGEIVYPPITSPLKVNTLTGFADALKAGGAFDPAEYLIHVEDHLTVSLKEREVDAWGRRAAHVVALHTPIETFKFDYYYNEPARFIIAVSVSFLQTEELLYLIRLASNLKAGNSVQVQDDGFSQSVVVKTGEVTSVEVRVRARVKLVPVRTFSEAAPVESEFLIRFQQNSSGAPSIALFDVDGRKWQGELMQSIKSWLAKNVDSGFLIIA